MIIDLTEFKTNAKAPELIANLYPKSRVSMLYGPSGVGKTVSGVKSLNVANIVPFVLDFDDNFPMEGVTAEYLDGKQFFEKFYLNEDISKADKIETVKDKYFILDTWAMYESFINLLNAREGKNKYDAWFILEEIARNSMGLCFIAHAKLYASRQDIPDINEMYTNHSAARFRLYYDKGTSSGKAPRPASYVLAIEKLRGYNGPREIRDWMR